MDNYHNHNKGAGAILLNELNEIAGLLLRVNIVVYLFGWFTGEKAEMGVVVLVFTLLGQGKVLVRDGYFQKPFIEKIVRTFAYVLAGTVISLGAVVSGEITLLNLVFEKPSVAEACWAYRTFICVLWYSAISINTSVFLKALLFVIDLV